MAIREKTDEEKEAEFLEIIKKLEHVSDDDLFKALIGDLDSEDPEELNEPKWMAFWRIRCKEQIIESSKLMIYLIRNSATICDQFKKATSNYITDLDDICSYDLYGFYYLIIGYLDKDLSKQVYEYCCESLDKKDCTFLNKGEPKNNFLKEAIDWINQNEYLEKYGVKCCIVTLLDGAEYLLLKYPKHLNTSFEEFGVRDMVGCNCKIHEYFFSVYNKQIKELLVKYKLK